jgi:hypothetical protein
VRQQARCDLLVESRKHSAVKLLRQIPAIGMQPPEPFSLQATALGLG